MLKRIFSPQQRAETPRVPETQRLAALKADVDMIVLSRRLVLVDDANAAGHAEMQHGRTCRRIQQQVFCTPTDGTNSLPGQSIINVHGHGPAKPAIADDNATDFLLLDPRRDAAATRFDFR